MENKGIEKLKKILVMGNLMGSTLAEVHIAAHNAVTVSQMFKSKELTETAALGMEGAHHLMRLFTEQEGMTLPMTEVMAQWEQRDKAFNTQDSKCEWN